MEGLQTAPSRVDEHLGEGLFEMFASVPHPWIVYPLTILVLWVAIAAFHVFIGRLLCWHELAMSEM